MAIALPKGTHDVYLDEARGYDYIEQVMKAVANCYGYTEMRTPIFEHTELMNYNDFMEKSGDVTASKAYEEDFTYALSNSLGFGGHNASILVKKYSE